MILYLFEKLENKQSRETYHNEPSYFITQIQ